MTCAVLTALPALAQPRPLQAALADSRVGTAIADVEAHTAWTADLLARLAAIISPSGHEKRAPTPWPRQCGRLAFSA
jgi:hypothetical protein